MEEDINCCKQIAFPEESASKVDIENQDTKSRE